MRLKLILESTKKRKSPEATKARRKRKVKPTHPVFSIVKYHRPL